MRNTTLKKSWKWLLCFALAMFGFFSYFHMVRSIPDEIRIIAGQEKTLNTSFPVVGRVDETNIAAFVNQSPGIEEGNFFVDYKLFGVLPIKKVSVEVVKEEEVVPCGIPIGIYVQTDGILAIGTGAVTAVDGLNYEPAYHLIKSGDYIKTVNDVVVKDKRELIKKINQYGKEDIILGVVRNGEQTQIKINPVCVGRSQYKIGVWVRDDLAGVGTLTCYSEDMKYAALGHPVSDSDTSTMISLGEGVLYETKILGITKGEKGKPGELSGVIDYQPKYRLGTVTENDSSGINGVLDKIPLGLEEVEPVPIAMRQEVQKGPATIVSNLSGERKEYEIEITAVDFNNSSENKGIQLRVTDSELLALTGGIVQGMSGSPILQNGKLIGAVTHVFVQDSGKGYGIFIENMLRSNG